VVVPVMSNVRSLASWRI